VRYIVARSLHLHCWKHSPQREQRQAEEGL
jgi:hypothetical protein